jgi:hypothetical protein
MIIGPHQDALVKCDLAGAREPDDVHRWETYRPLRHDLHLNYAVARDRRIASSGMLAQVLHRLRSTLTQPSLPLMHCPIAVLAVVRLRRRRSLSCRSRALRVALVGGHRSALEKDHHVRLQIHHFSIPSGCRRRTVLVVVRPVNKASDLQRGAAKP